MKDMDIPNVLAQSHGKDWHLWNGDCVEVIRGIPDNSIDFSVYSPPFSSIYIYSESERDMGNTHGDDSFMDAYLHMLEQKYRVTRPGRLTAVHVKDLVYYQNSDEKGRSGIRPFSDMVTAAHVACGWTFHCRITIWRDPVLERGKTNAHGLLRKTRRSDASFVRVGMPEYLMIYRKWATEDDKHLVKPLANPDYPTEAWQQEASPVWAGHGIWNWQEGQSGKGDFDLPATQTLNVKAAKDEEAEKHLCIGRDAQVLTVSGFKSIQDIEPGEMVLTHMGRWRRVVGKMNTGVRPVVRLHAKGVPGLIMTPSHNVWSRVVPSGGKWDHVRARKNAVDVHPRWARADECVGSYVNAKVPPAMTSIFDPEDLWVAGRWLADGHIGARGEIIISCGASKVDALKARLGRRLGFVADYGSASQFRVKDRDGVIRKIIETCGVGAANKQFPAFAYELPQSHASALLDGYLSGDGHFDPKKRKYMGTSVSKRLVLGASLLFYRVHGNLASVFEGRGPRTSVIEGREVSCLQEWNFSAYIEDENRRVRPFVLEDGHWSKVARVEHHGESETWCLKVEEDESFYVDGCMVKNCPMPLNVTSRALQIWSAPGETVLSPFAGIGSEGVASLRAGRKFVGIELKPAYYHTAVKYLLEEQQRASMDMFAESKS